MPDLTDLYQQVIIDHGRHPRNFCACPDADHIQEGYNPLCGDRCTIYLREHNGRIESASFQGSGCAISMASASLMTEAVKGKTREEFDALFARLHSVVMGQGAGGDLSALGKLAVLAGVAEFPARVKCATLAWHTLKTALAGGAPLE